RTTAPCGKVVIESPYQKLTLSVPNEVLVNGESFVAQEISKAKVDGGLTCRLIRESSAYRIQISVYALGTQQLNQSVFGGRSLENGPMNPRRPSCERSDLPKHQTSLMQFLDCRDDGRLACVAPIANFPQGGIRDAIPVGYGAKIGQHDE